jgi:hypothetical protein
MEFVDMMQTTNPSVPAMLVGSENCVIFLTHVHQTLVKLMAFVE